MGVTDEIADDISYRVLNYFGNGVEIIDNALDQDDRRLFYFLQDCADPFDPLGRADLTNRKDMEGILLDPEHG